MNLVVCVESWGGSHNGDSKFVAFATNYFYIFFSIIFRIVTTRVNRIYDLTQLQVGDVDTN